MSTKHKVLLVDDDKELQEMMGEYLSKDGFDVAFAHDGENGIRKLLNDHFEIAVVDVMMPGMDGIEMLRKIRTVSPIPVIMLTAKGDDADRITGLELGADDYVAKPCTARELSARIRAILKRVGNQKKNTVYTIRTGMLAIWPEKRRVEWNNQAIELTSTEFDLLEVLARNLGQVVSKDTLSSAALGRPLMRFDRAIDVHMSNIRQKLGAMPDGRDFIQTVFRKGYMLVKE